jgi:hypothetical protein
VTHRATTVPLRVGAHLVELPAELLVGADLRMRLPRSPITRTVDGVTVVVGDAGTGWIDHTVRPVGGCYVDADLEPDLDDDRPHLHTVCPECIDSWACDWQLELVLAVDGSGEV